MKTKTLEGGHHEYIAQVVDRTVFQKSAYLLWQTTRESFWVLALSIGGSVASSCTCSDASDSWAANIEQMGNLQQYLLGFKKRQIKSMPLDEHE